MGFVSNAHLACWQPDSPFLPSQDEDSRLCLFFAKVLSPLASKSPPKLCTTRAQRRRGPILSDRLPFSAINKEQQGSSTLMNPDETIPVPHPLCQRMRTHGQAWRSLTRPGVSGGSGSTMAVTVSCSIFTTPRRMGKDWPSTTMNPGNNRLTTGRWKGHASKTPCSPGRITWWARPLNRRSSGLRMATSSIGH